PPRRPGGPVAAGIAVAGGGPGGAVLRGRRDGAGACPHDRGGIQLSPGHRDESGPGPPPAEADALPVPPTDAAPAGAGAAPLDGGVAAHAGGTTAVSPLRSVGEDSTSGGSAAGAGAAVVGAGGAAVDGVPGALGRVCAQHEPAAGG